MSNKYIKCFSLKLYIWSKNIYICSLPILFDQLKIIGLHQLTVPSKTFKSLFFLTVDGGFTVLLESGLLDTDVNIFNEA